MPFRKFFDRSTKPAPSQLGPETAEPGDDEFDGEPEASPEESDAVDWRARAAQVIPNGASTGSKRPAALYGADDAVGPTHFSGSVGCRVIDMDGNEYIDCSMALGSVALGYAEPTVTKAVIEAATVGSA